MHDAVTERATIRDCIGPMACFVALGLYVGVWAALVPALKVQAAVTAGELGIAMLLGSVATPLAMYYASPLVERFGTRVVAYTTAAFAASTLLPVFATNFTLLVVALVVLSCLAATLDITMNVAVSCLEHFGRHVMHLSHALFSAGMLAGSLAAGTGRHLGGGPAEILPVLAAALVAIAALNLRRPTVDLAHVPVEEDSGAGDGSTRKLVLSPYLLLLGAMGCVAFVFEGAIEAWSALHLEENLGVGAGASAIGPAAFALTMMLGRIFGHWITRGVDPYALLVASGVLGAGGVLAAALTNQVPMAVAGIICAAVGLATAVPTLYGLAGRAAERGQRGATMFTVTSVSWLGVVLGPAMVGGIAAAVDLRAALAWLGALGIPMAASALLARRLRPDRVPATA